MGQNVSLAKQFNTFEMSRRTSTENVRLSYWAFAVWWGLIFTVHMVTSIYNALYAYSYWVLQDVYLNMYLNAYQIGMASPYHHTISVVHAFLAAIHALCFLIMLGGSIWQRTLTFTPWSLSDVKVNNVKVKSRHTNGGFMKVFGELLDRRGLCGVNGAHFHAVLVFREIVETILQTVQAYRMSVHLPRTLLNRFYVILLGINCWSPVIVYSSFFKTDEARRRLACIVLDCVLDLMSCMGVELLILLSYANEYDTNLHSFNDFKWYDDEWVARALNEFQMIVVVSWLDLASRAIFSLGLVLTTTNMKELLQRLPKNGNRVATVNLLEFDEKKTSIKLSGRKSILKRSDSYRNADIQSRRGQFMLRTAHLLFGIWGVVVTGLHIDASLQPTLPQCLTQVKPWAASKPSCYLAGLDCHVLGISGKMEEVELMWSEFDSSTVVQLLIRHCPELEVPEIINDFHALRGIKVYNTSIVEWGASAALTSTNHPGMSSLLVARVSMKDGLLPLGLQSDDFPPTVYDIELCATNLREIPDDLDTKWPPGAIIILEYCQLRTIPLVFVRLQPYYLILTGNQLTTVPPEVFEIEGLLFLGISEMDIDDLPQNVTQLSSTLVNIYIGQTDIAFFWAWADELLERIRNVTYPWLAMSSKYCNDLEKIENGTADTFAVPLSPEYSQLLMDPSPENRDNILFAVNCDYPEDSLFYPIHVDDGLNAISTPPPLVRQKY